MQPEANRSTTTGWKTWTGLGPAKSAGGPLPGPKSSVGAEVLGRAYCASKPRTHDALRDSRSFVIRAEFGISWHCFKACWLDCGSPLESCSRTSTPTVCRTPERSSWKYTRTACGAGRTSLPVCSRWFGSGVGRIW